jgi:hypothetical protein
MTTPTSENRTVRRERRLSIPEQHALRIARDTLRMPDAIAAVMGGPDKKTARKIVRRLTGAVEG